MEETRPLGREAGPRDEGPGWWRRMPAPRVLLALVVALGAALRFFRLDYQSLWNDELSSWVRSGFPSLGEVIRRGAVPDVHPPGYYLVLHVVQTVFGDSEWALRAPSAIFGTLTLIAVYALARCLYEDREGLVAAALTATLWAPLSISQDARPYALLVLLATLTMRASYEVMLAIREDRPLSRPWFVATVAASAACAYTHYFGALLVALEGMACTALAAASKRRFATVAAVYATVTSLFLPWLPSFMSQLGRGPGWIKPVRAEYLRELPRYLFNRSNLLTGIVALIAAAALTKAFLGRRDTREQGSPDHGFADRAVVWWLLAPVAASALLSWMVVPVVTHKNLLICLPPAVVLVARSIRSLGPPRWLPVALSLVLVGGSLLQLLAVVRYYTTPSNTQFREAVRYVIEHDRAAGSPPIAACVWNRRYLDYYFQHLGSDLRVRWVGCDVPALAAALGPGEAASLERVWFVTAPTLRDADVLAWLGRHYQLLDSKALVDAYVLLLQRRPPAGPDPTHERFAPVSPATGAVGDDAALLEEPGPDDPLPAVVPRDR